MLDEDQQNQDEQEVTSEEEGETSQETTPRTYSEDDVRNFKSDIKTEQGRRQKAESKAEALKSKVNQLQDQIDDIELNGLPKDDKSAQTNYALRKQLRKMQDELDQAREDLEAEREKSKEASASQLKARAQAIANKYTGIDVDDLVSLPEDRWEAFAKKYGKPKGKVEKEEVKDTPEKEGEVEKGKGHKPLTAQKGGKTEPTQDDLLKARYPSMFSK